MTSGDTIAAISTTVGPAARMIVRVSGPLALTLGERLGAQAGSPGGAACRTMVQFCGVHVPAFLYLFRGPRSYTGEDLVEFHLPGNPVLVRMLLQHLVECGARHAVPGEFTARAYFNGRLDLAQAEGVAAAIAAGNEQELAAARRLLAGELARRLAPAMQLIADTLSLVELGIDFSEEDVSVISAGELLDRVRQADQLLARLLDESGRFDRLCHQPRVVLAGRPNAGKSTLLNTLAGRTRAVVSPVAGTTRDTLSAEVMLPGGAVVVTDLAGIEPIAPRTSDIDRQMQEHALRAMESADIVVLVKDVTDPRPLLQLAREPAVIVLSKADLIDKRANPAPSGELHLSAITGAGIDQLRRRLDAVCFGEPSSAWSISLNVRHVQLIEEARHSLTRASSPHEGGDAARLAPELLAVDLREALDALGGILGHVSPDELLGRIFSSFCIGK